MSWAMTGCGDKMTQSAFVVVVVVAFCNRHWEVASFSFPFCFFNSKIHEFIPAILSNVPLWEFTNCTEMRGGGP